MIKKLLIMSAMLLLFTGCEASKKQNADISYSRDDLCIYTQADENGYSYPYLWLGMTESEIDIESEYFDCFSENDMVFSSEVNQAQNSVNKILKYINYSGGIRKGMQTVKGIYSTGRYFNEEMPSSTSNDVIAVYGLDIENESIITNKIDDNNYAINLFFSDNNDEENTVTRNIYPINTNIEDFNTLDDADYQIRFLIIDNYVQAIQMFKK